MIRHRRANQKKKWKQMKNLIWNHRVSLFIFEINYETFILFSIVVCKLTWRMFDEKQNIRSIIKCSIIATIESNDFHIVVLFSSYYVQQNRKQISFNWNMTYKLHWGMHFSNFDLSKTKKRKQDETYEKREIFFFFKLKMIIWIIKFCRFWICVSYLCMYVCHSTITNFNGNNQYQSD